MKKLKWILIVSLAFLMVGMTFVGTKSVEAAGYKFFNIPKWTGFPYFDLLAEGSAAAAEELGDTCIYVGPDYADPQLQVQAIENVIAQKADGILLAAIDRNAVAPSLKVARSRGIVVTTFDADSAVDSRDFFANQMTYEQAARVMLDMALLAVPEGGEIAFIAASPTSPNHMAHYKWMNDLIEKEKKYSSLKFVDIQYAQDDDAKSYEVTINLMQAYPDLKVIISSSAVSAPAAARAIQATDKVGKVYATGFALPSAIKGYLKDGSQVAFALWDPWELGYLAAYITHLALEGELKNIPGTKFTAGKIGEFEVGEDGEIVYGKALIFTKDNVDDYDF